MPLPEEDLLHFIWKYRLYKNPSLITVAGNALQVLDTGIHNKDAGPDFHHTRIRIADTEWVGNVEIHVRTSDWDVHRHQHDKTYNNVVLHVVYVHDREIKREDGTIPDTLELQSLIDESMHSKYREMMSGMYWIPCEKLLYDVPDIIVSQWLPRLLVERFEQRVSAVYALLNQQQGNWEETCYIWMARCFGFKVNSLAFEQLASATPQAIIAKYRDNSLAVEALLFGQAGMLDDQEFGDEYPRQLQQEYSYLKKLHSLSPMSNVSWKFLRMRPSNFPTMRIAQFAALCLNASHLFAKFIETEDPRDLKAELEGLPVHPYWLQHYRFDAASPAHGCQLGTQSVDTLLINAVSVILFAYGKYVGKEVYIYRAVELLDSLKAEKNEVIRRFSILGIRANQASASQALLQMKTFYCDKKKCLDCGIGLRLIKHS